MTKRVQIIQINEIELTPDDLISIGELMKLIEFISDEYTFKSKVLIKDRTATYDLRKKTMSKTQIIIGSINKNSPIDICILIVGSLLTLEILELVFSGKFQKLIVPFHQRLMKGSSLSEYEKVRIRQRYAKWNSALKVVKRLALIYNDNNCK
jgi:hypothetical protein